MTEPNSLFPAYSDEEWQQRLARAVEETLRRKAARRAERTEFKTRRDFGLVQRHAQKLNRNAAESLAAQQNSGEEMTTTPPCCAGLAEECPQHRQQAGDSWNRGPRSRSGGGQRVVGESGRARPAPVPEEQS